MQLSIFPKLKFQPHQKVWFFDTIKRAPPGKEDSYMNYTQLTEKKKVEIEILLKQGMSMRQVGLALGISHSTISRYKAGIYKKRKIDINKK